MWDVDTNGFLTTHSNPTQSTDLYLFLTISDLVPISDN